MSTADEVNKVFNEIGSTDNPDASKSISGTKVNAEVNVEEIMAEIRHEIKEKGYKNDDITFYDILIFGSDGSAVKSHALINNIRNLQGRQCVSAYRPIKSRRIIGPVIVFIKKIIRKLTSFYVEPIVGDQNEFNKLTTSCVVDLYMEVEAMRSKIRQLEEEIKKS